MKLQNFFQLAFIFLFAALVLVSCKDDEDDTKKAPVASFTFSPTSPKVGETVTFTNTSTDAETFVWSATGAAFSSTEKNPTFTFTTEGAVQVTLTASGDGGTNANTQTVTVLGEDAPPPPTYPANYTTGTDAATSRASVTVKADPIGIGETAITWTKDKVWILDGFVFVNEGQTLTIEAGTVVKAKPGEQESASALVVARGAKIMAKGTAAEPIIFTAEKDPLDGSLGVENGLWGGVIVLGKTTIARGTAEASIEGIPTTEGRGLYGGTDDDDNSGELSYISIRHGGTSIAANNEINGLTLGAVGRGTKIDHIEVFANQDDGFEWFGGTVNAKYLVSTACGDEAYDTDLGFRGINQFVVAYQRTDDGENGGEHDGGDSPKDAQPYATATFYNATYVGRGNGGKNRVFYFQDNAGGEYHNSIFVGFEQGLAVQLTPSGENSYKRFQEGTLKVMNNTFFNVASNDVAALSDIITPSGADIDAAVLDAAKLDLATYFTESGNKVEDLGITRSNLVPTATGGDVSETSNTFLSPAAYRGAIEPGTTPWYNGWTMTASYIQ
ncbi:hypothetical protein V9L05_06630 [Bernardetia sp. Wsw4-3y2]|uniref:hypothetical protein n=1 Tax=unclassified Bernardetia TaxID=2647129 RepID=UPI0030D10F49